jgi:hypothetical protein
MVPKLLWMTIIGMLIITAAEMSPYRAYIRGNGINIEFKKVELKIVVPLSIFGREEVSRKLTIKHSDK